MAVFPLDKSEHPDFEFPLEPFVTNDVELDQDNEFAKYVRYATTSGNNSIIEDLVGRLSAPGAIRDGKAFALNGEVDLGVSASISNLQPMSIVARVRITSESSGDALIRKGASDQANGGWSIDVDSNSSDRLRFTKDGAGGNATVASSNQAYVPGVTFDLVFRWNGNHAGENQIFMDVDGVTTQGTTPGTFSTDSTQTLRLGNSNNSIMYEYFYLLEKELSFEEGQSLRRDPKQIWKPAVELSAFSVDAAAVSAAITGTMTATVNEDDLTAGGKTLIGTITGDTLKAAGTGPIGSIADTQALIDGFDAASSPANGWNNEVRDKALTSEIVRTSDTVFTWTVAAQAGYDISAQEVITGTIPTDVLVTGAGAITAVPTFTIDAVVAGRIMGSLANLGGLAGMGGLAGRGGGLAG